MALGLAEAMGALSREGFGRLAPLLGVALLLAGFAYSRYQRPAEPAEDYWKYGYLSLVLLQKHKAEAVYLQSRRYEFLLVKALEDEGLPPERIFMEGVPYRSDPSLLVRYKRVPPLLDVGTFVLQKWTTEVARPRRIYEDGRGEVWFLPGPSKERGRPGTPPGSSR